MKRRILLGGAAGVTLGAVLQPGLAVAEDSSPGTSGLNGPPTTGPADLDFQRNRHGLRYGNPRKVDLVPEHVDRIVSDGAEYVSGPNPVVPGFVVLAARDGVVVQHEAAGYQFRYGSWDDTTGTAVELPPDEWEPMTKDTIFDMASVSKLFTATVAGRLLDDGLLDLDAPVADYIPAFAGTDPQKAAITVRHLLSHTSGMIAFINLYGEVDDEARMARIFDYPLNREPGSGYEYSDLNMIVLAEIMEGLTGKELDEMVAEYITVPLGMTDTFYNPPPEVHHRVAATEYQPWTGRGMIRGDVHDENAWSFGGVAGHAGVFASAWDLATFGQMVLGGGKYRDVRILNEETARLFFTNMNPQFGAGAARGLGWQIDQRWFMDAMTSPVTIGHTGYTGTSLVLDPIANTMMVMLTNRVHPTRERATGSNYRVGVHRPMARAVTVDARTGRDAWYSGQTDLTTTTLTAPLARPLINGSAEFALWYDSEASDIGSVEASADGETWEPVSLHLSTGRNRWETDGTFSGYSGRQWIDATADLPNRTRYVRWSYASDTLYQGRGIYVDKIKIRQGRRVVFNSARPADNASLIADGWSLSRN